MLLQKASVAEMALSISQAIAQLFDSDSLQQLLDELEQNTEPITPQTAQSSIPSPDLKPVCIY